MSTPVQFSTLLDALPQQVWKADAQGRLLWMNARLAEALNRPALPTALAQWLHADDRDAFTQRWAEAQARAHALQQWDSLTQREREVARLVGLGWANKEIARQLEPPCSPRSVETHRAHLFAKLGLGNDNELGRWLTRQGWLVGGGV